MDPDTEEGKTRQDRESSPLLQQSVEETAPVDPPAYSASSETVPGYQQLPPAPTTHPATVTHPPGQQHAIPVWTGQQQAYIQPSQQQQQQPVPSQPIPLQQAPVYQPAQQAVIQPVQYTVGGIPPITAFPRPSYNSPHSHLPLVVVTLLICSLFNVTSLALGIPAIVLSILAYHAVEKNQWKAAQNYGSVALYLSIANWIYTLTIALIILGSTMGVFYRSRYYYFY